MEFCFLLSSHEDSVASPAVDQVSAGTDHALRTYEMLVLKVRRDVVGSWKLLQSHMEATGCKGGAAQKISTGRRLAGSAGAEQQLES